MGNLENFFFEYGMHFWLALAFALGILEILTVAFFALPFALGAVVTSIFAATGMPLNGQLIVFAISSFLMLFVIQFLFRKYFLSKEGQQVRTNASALVGREVLVLEPIEGSHRRGTVKVGGEIWSAVTQSGQTLEKESMVVVTAVSGATLTVDTPEAAAAIIDETSET